MSNESKNSTSLLNKVFSPKSDQATRRAGHHATQIAVDTIAYAFNIPLRLLLLNKLRDVPSTIKALLEADEDSKSILQNEAPDLKAEHYDQLANKFLDARSWILSLATDTPQDRPSLADGWEQGMLILLPHLERQIWLTENANPLPAHALGRMQDQWALFILMWCSAHADKFGNATPIQNVMGVAGLMVHPLQEFIFTDRQGTSTPCIPVIGPIFEYSNAADQADHQQFQNTFRRYIANTGKHAHRWKSGSLTPPSRDELDDALEARMDLSKEETILRADQARNSLHMLLTAEASDNVLPLSRMRCETTAMLTSWLARWNDYLAGIIKEGDQVALSARNSQITLMAKRTECGWQLNITEGRDSSEIHHIDEILKSNDTACHVDGIDAFTNRIRERQSAAWSAQIIAINNLLNRHDTSTTSDTRNATTQTGERYKDQAEHLLRGFGGRICRHLVSITRADIADLYWLDYGQSPPRLIHAGGYARMRAHRAKIEETCKNFDDWAWKEENLDPSATPCAANLRDKSPSQAYRVAATGREDPQPKNSKEPSVRKRMVPWKKDGNPQNDEEAVAYFDGFTGDTKPRDAMAHPLLINGRVVGVVTLAGLVEQQFDARLFVPIRRAASLIATCMYHQSQLQQMGKLNSLFAESDPFDLQRHDPSNHYNPLFKISRCLCNIFLCPVAHLWLRSRSNPNRYELHGYNWPSIFNINSSPANGKQEFIYQEMDRARNPSKDSFSDLAIDMCANNPALHPGKFVQGHFSDTRKNTTGFDAETASTIGCALGNDFVNDDSGNPTYPAYRKRIFLGPPDGHALCDIMSFVLLKHNDGVTPDIGGIITLHDWGNSNRDAQLQPWDKGWSSVVSYMQTYLPYLLTQAEVMQNPLMEARRFLIHAGRAELIGVLDTTSRLRTALSNCLAPDRGVRHALDEVMDNDFKGDYRVRLAGAHIALRDAWQSVEQSISLAWEQNLTQLANIMHEYRNIARLDIPLAEASETIGLQQQINQILSAYKNKFRLDGIFTDSDVPENVRLRMPALWFRIILGDLLHNAAKYATSGQALSIVWNDSSQTLTLRNEGPYRSDLDIEGRLLESGTRGSASTTERLIHNLTAVNRKGQGLGLWGAKVMSEVMGIKFGLKIIPKRATLRSIDDKTLQGKATYEITLKFPNHMLGNVISSTKDYY